MRRFTASSASPAIASALNGVGIFWSLASSVKTSKRPGSELWDSVRTASMRDASILARRKPTQPIERQDRVVWPEHPQSAFEHGRRRFRVSQECRNIFLAGHLVSGPADLVVESLERRERRLKQIPRGRARGQPRQQLRDETH